MSKIEVKNLNFFYDDFQALSNISLDIRDRQITALIGPSGCGKSTFLRCLNRMNVTIHGTRLEGKILLDGQDIYAEDTDVVNLRRRVGMVFQRPNPFPKSIYNNVAFGPRVLGLHKEEPLDDIVQSLGLSSIDFLKIDIEGYVGKALPGMAWSLKNSKYVMIELLRRDLIVHRHLKSLRLRLTDKHGSNYLYVRY